MNWPLASSAGLNVSTVSSCGLVSNIAGGSRHDWMLAVHVTSVVPSQNPIVSPYHCGTFCTCAVLPTITWRRKLSAMPDRNCTFHGVMVSWKLPACDGRAHHRMKPSGQQKDALRCGALVTASCYAV